MTYCIGMRLEKGMVFISDTRTNAGVDHISTYRKMYRFGIEKERVIVLLTAGNLATSQAVINMLRRDIHSNSDNNLLTVPTLFEAAEMIGGLATGIARKSQSNAMSQEGFGSTFILGGQIKGHSAKLYMIYNEGNCIFATRDTPYFQIGESKYGKPILDRAITYNSAINDAIRAALVSFDSTIRSNLSVGFPLDILVYETDSLHLPEGKRIEESEPYFRTIRSQWSHGLISLLQHFDQPPDEYLR